MNEYHPPLGLTAQRSNNNNNNNGTAQAAPGSNISIFNIDSTSDVEV